MDKRAPMSFEPFSTSVSRFDFWPSFTNLLRDLNLTARFSVDRDIVKKAIGKLMVIFYPDIPFIIHDWRLAIDETSATDWASHWSCFIRSSTNAMSSRGPVGTSTIAFEHSFDFFDSPRNASCQKCLRWPRHFCLSSVFCPLHHINGYFSGQIQSPISCVRTLKVHNSCEKMPCSIMANDWQHLKHRSRSNSTFSAEVFKLLANGENIAVICGRNTISDSPKMHQNWW